MQEEPPFARIAATIRRRIETGELAAGDRVPSTRQITKEWGVAMATATKVLATLRQEGLVTSRVGIGTVVAPTEPTATPDAPAAPAASGAPNSAAARGAPARGGAGEITREQVLRVAIAIADAEGAAAVSMRRVAGELGVATMSLYRHVSSKEDLVAEMIDLVLGDQRLTGPPPAHWRRGLELAARRLWSVFRRHPWAAAAMSLTRPQATPNALAYAEWVMRVLSGTGLSGYQMFQVHLTWFGYVRGTAVNLEWESTAEAETGITFEQFMDTQDARFTALVSSGAFPTFREVAAHAGFDLDLDELFEFGLRHLLDGFAGLLR